jgi:hypothetical protein
MSPGARSRLGRHRRPDLSGRCAFRPSALPEAMRGVLEVLGLGPFFLLASLAVGTAII